MIALASVGLADVSRVATSGLVAAVWQGMLLAAVVWVGLRMLPKTPAAVRFSIWFGVFALVTALPFISLLPHSVGIAKTSGRGAWLMLDERWSLAIAAVWAFASLLRTGTLVVAAFRVRALWKRARPVEIEEKLQVSPLPHRLPSVAQGPGEMTNLKSVRRVQLCTSDEVDRPTVIGFFAPKILIPEWLLEKLTAAELEQIVRHEAEHLGRADDWMNLLQKIALVIFPLNPALAWVERRLCFERELACDERVLRDCEAPKAYAACLVALAEHRMGRKRMVSELALALGALGRESELGQRVREILGRGERMRPLQAKLVLGGAMFGLLVGAVGLERCPQVVGFAKSDSSAQVAAVVAPMWKTGRFGYEDVVFHPGVQRLNPTHRDSAAMNGAPNMVAGSGVLHPTLRKFAKDGAPGPLLHDSHASEVKRDTPNGVPNAVGNGQWVVVTAWSSADGARVIQTVEAVRPRVREDHWSSDFAEPETDSAEPEEPAQVHPYAAVPMRGGWLVIQL